MKLKTVTLEGKTYAEVQDDKPVYTQDDGKDSPFDVPDMYSRLTRDGRQNADLRRSVEEQQARLKAFEGIEDPEIARKALETVKNLKEGELFQAGQVEEIKTNARRAAEEQVAAAHREHAKTMRATEKERDKYRTELDTTLLGLAFERSKFVSEKASVPATMMQAQFGANFKREEGKFVGYYPNGEKIFSTPRPGDTANFDEAIEKLVEQYPDRDRILKGSGSRGGGDGGRPGNGWSGNGRTMKMEAFNALSPGQQAQLMGGKDRPTLVD